MKTSNLRKDHAIHKRQRHPYPSIPKEKQKKEVEARRGTRPRIFRDSHLDLPRWDNKKSENLVLPSRIAPHRPPQVEHPTGIPWATWTPDSKCDANIPIWRQTTRRRKPPT